jgi:hypothetical protein
VGVWAKVESFLDKFFLELDVLVAQSFNFSDESDTLVDAQRVPDSVVLWAHSHLVALGRHINAIEVGV